MKISYKSGGEHLNDDGSKEDIDGKDDNVYLLSI